MPICRGFLSLFFCETEGGFIWFKRTDGIPITDFHKDWARRVRVHFDQVRSFSELHILCLHLRPILYRTTIRFESRSGNSDDFGGTDDEIFFLDNSPARSTAVVRPVSRRPLLSLPVRLTSCVRLCDALPLSTTAASAPVVVLLSPS